MDKVEFSKMSPMMQQKHRLGEPHPTLAMLKILDRVEELEKQIGRVTEIILQAGKDKVKEDIKKKTKKS